MKEHAENFNALVESYGHRQFLSVHWMHSLTATSALFCDVCTSKGVANAETNHLALLYNNASPVTHIISASKQPSHCPKKVDRRQVQL